MNISNFLPCSVILNYWLALSSLRKDYQSLLLDYQSASKDWSLPEISGTEARNFKVSLILPDDRQMSQNMLPRNNT